MSTERLEFLIGRENITKLQTATVAVIGLGGVGGVSAITLARCGVGTLIIQDFDVVEPSNINRQIIANYETIGRYKTDLVEEEIRKINPDCKIIKLQERYNVHSSLFNYKFDFLIDAIDKIDDKFHLIKTCLKNKVNFISSMGAAKKMDQTKLAIMDIWKTSYDPLAKILRKKLKDERIYDKIIVGSSTEDPKKIPNLGSYMPVTASMGLLLADYVIKKIIQGEES